MTREKAEALVNDLLDACVDYERAVPGQIRRAQEDYRAAKEAVIAALSSTEREP